MSKKQKMRIVNPRDAGQRFTTELSAADMVRRGAAVYVTSNSHRVGVRLIDDVERRRSCQAQLAIQIETSISRDRGDLFFWDGCKPGSNSIPRLGVVGNQAFPAPDEVSAGVNPSAFNPDKPMPANYGTDKKAREAMNLIDLDPERAALLEWKPSRIVHRKLSHSDCIGQTH